MVKILSLLKESALQWGRFTELVEELYGADACVVTLPKIYGEPLLEKELNQIKKGQRIDAYSLRYVLKLGISCTSFNENEFMELCKGAGYSIYYTPKGEKHLTMDLLNKYFLHFLFSFEEDGTDTRLILKFNATLQRNSEEMCTKCSIKKLDGDDKYEKCAICISYFRSVMLLKGLYTSLNDAQLIKDIRCQISFGSDDSSDIELSYKKVETAIESLDK